MSVVSAVQCKNYIKDEILSALRKGIKLAGDLTLSSCDTLAIKINMCDARPPETGAITHPVFLDVLLQYLRESYDGLEIHIVESDCTVVMADEFIRWFGYMPILEKWEAKWHNLSKGKVVQIPIDGYYLKEVPVPEILTRSKLLSLSKLKTNSASKITASLKNQFGCLPMVQKSIFHDVLPKVIADVNRVIKPVLSIVDGIIAMGGPNGPSFGVPVCAEVILAGKDLVAVDSVSAAIIGISPSKVKHIKLAANAGIGSMNYKLVGDSIPDVDFELSRLADFQSWFIDIVKKTQRIKLRTSWKNNQQSS